MHYIIYTHIYIERNESDLKSKLYWPGPPLTKTNTINNCIGICLLKMLRNAVYSFAAPFAVEIVIVMIEHYIHTYIHIYTDRLITYIFMCCIGQQEFVYIVTNQVHIHSEQYIEEKYVLSICILLSTLGLCLFTSCYKL